MSGIRDDWDVIADIFENIRGPKHPLLINLSLPKTSSLSLVDYCKEYCYATHEAWHTEITSAVVKNRNGLYPNNDLIDFYRIRNANFQHDVDSATFNHLLMEEIFSIFPNSSYIYIYRNCCSWIASMLNMWNSFDTLHKKRILGGDMQEVRSSREWISWINNYSTLYSPNLSVYFWRRSNYDSNDPYFKQLSCELMEFWIQLGERILKAKQTDVKLYTIPLSQSDKIPDLVQNIFGSTIDFKSSIYPSSNKRVDDLLHLTANQIAKVIPDSLLKKSDLIYTQLLNT